MTDQLGKATIVTGGAKGIGEGCARVFCEAGGNVLICDIDRPSGERLAEELTKKGPGKCRFERADVRNPMDIQRVIDQGVEFFGRLDCLISNAGWHRPSRPIDDFSIEDFLDLLQLNLVSVFAGCKFALPHLRKTKGSIINISSLVAVIGQEMATTYCATKGGVSALTKGLGVYAK